MLVPVKYTRQTTNELPVGWWWWSLPCHATLQNWWPPHPCISPQRAHCRTLPSTQATGLRSPPPAGKPPQRSPRLESSRVKTSVLSARHKAKHLRAVATLPKAEEGFTCRHAPHAVRSTSTFVHRTGNGELIGWAAATHGLHSPPAADGRPQLRGARTRYPGIPVALAIAHRHIAGMSPCVRREALLFPSCEHQAGPRALCVVSIGRCRTKVAPSLRRTTTHVTLSCATLQQPLQTCHDADLPLPRLPVASPRDPHLCHPQRHRRCRPGLDRRPHKLGFPAVPVRAEL